MYYLVSDCKENTFGHDDQAFRSLTWKHPDSLQYKSRLKCREIVQPEPT